jgi:hypothetical protein
MKKTLLAVFAAWSLSTMLQARQDRPVSSTTRDWTGFYNMASGKDLEGFMPVNLDLHPVIVEHLQPWARLKMEATDGIAEDTGQLCQLTGIFRNPPFAGSFLWLPGSDKIVIAYGATNTAGVQRIYLNRDHPRNLRPGWNGDSIGHWEGDTLVVDTIGFNDKSWLQPTMEPHTEQAHLIQRIRRVGKNNDLIEIQYTVEDWKALTSAYTYTRYYKKTGESMRENICNEDPEVWREFKNKRLTPIVERSREVR